ncbi:MAG: VOC family protein [Deltaproteobacteria bacterium]|nr:MAG: VOC family protein [Deltaproteobacteria bacterium]
MVDCVHAGEQLVVVLYVRNIKESSDFYEGLGFEITRDEGTFMELRWEKTLLFLEERGDAPPPDSNPVGNMRIMVPNVDHYWALSKSIGAVVIRPIETRYYGLRDFTIAGPDGLGLRFATRLQDLPSEVEENG